MNIPISENKYRIGLDITLLHLEFFSLTIQTQAENLALLENSVPYKSCSKSIQIWGLISQKVHEILDKYANCKSFSTDVDIHVCSVPACVDLKAVFSDARVQKQSTGHCEGSEVFHLWHER